MSVIFPLFQKSNFLYFGKWIVFLVQKMEWVMPWHDPTT